MLEVAQALIAKGAGRYIDESYVFDHRVPTGLQGLLDRIAMKVDYVFRWRVYPRVIRARIETTPESAGRIATMFERANLDVQYAPPGERRSLGHDLLDVVYYLTGSAGSGIVGSAAYARAEAVIQRLREANPDLRATLQEDPEGISDTQPHRP